MIFARSSFLICAVLALVAADDVALDEVCYADGTCYADGKVWQVVMAKDPSGRHAVESDFEIVRIGKPGTLKEGELRLRPVYLSVDPYMRGQLNRKIGKTAVGYQVAEVAESRSPDFRQGSFVHCRGPWQEEFVSAAASLPEVYIVPREDSAARVSSTVPLSAYVGALGMPGKTAFGGVARIGDLRDGKPGALAGAHVVVSGAAGVVGAAVGQMAKAMGAAFVIGTAGSQEKVQHLLDLGFDAAISYKDKGTAAEMEAAIREALVAAGRPEHVDFYFDNTGGHVTTAVWALLHDGARVAVCGGIVHYEHSSWDFGRWAEMNGISPAGFPRPTKIGDPVTAKDAGRSITVESFIWSELHKRKPYLREFFPKVHEWIADGRFRITETVLEGYRKVPAAMVGLFTGANVGKMVVKV